MFVSMKQSSHRIFLALILALAVMFAWSAAAYAVTPEGVQYGSPTGGVGDATGTGGSSGGSGLTGGSGSEGSTGGSGSVALVGTAETGDDLAGSVGLTGLLPETGGPLFSLVALASAALIGTGLILLRYNLKTS